MSNPNPPVFESIARTALAVYAPFGDDAVLSTYPDGDSAELLQHPLVDNLAQVAALGFPVLALIDRAGQDTVLLEFAPGGGIPKARSRWKLDMNSPLTLAGFVTHARQFAPGAELVLSLEGHGAGFLPEIDRTAIQHMTSNQGVQLEWNKGGFSGAPTLPMGRPILPMGRPILPMGRPILPTKNMPLSTWALGQALRLATEPPERGNLALVHFNNCFNMSIEVLHTIAPYAAFATGYPNYNFFSAGDAYVAAFRQLHRRLQGAGRATAADLTQWLAEANRDTLKTKPNHPTVGCAVDLSRMKEISERLDDLADALLAALRSAPYRGAVVAEIQTAIVLAQQYDSIPANFDLETPDELTDLRSLAEALTKGNFPPSFNIDVAAHALLNATTDIKVYGDVDSPWMNSASTWDFSGSLALNILLPDPLRKGIWDWRSPFYLDVNPDPALPPIQPGIIEFLKVTDWVDFIIEYHKDVPFVGLLDAEIPTYPAFNPRERPNTQPGKGDGNPDQSAN